MKSIVNQLKADGWKQTISTPKRTTLQRDDEIVQITTKGIIYRLISQYKDSQPAETKQERIEW